MTSQKWQTGMRNHIYYHTDYIIWSVGLSCLGRYYNDSVKITKFEDLHDIELNIFSITSMRWKNLIAIHIKWNNNICLWLIDKACMLYAYISSLKLMTCLIYFIITEDLVDTTVWHHWIDISVPSEFQFTDASFLNIASGNIGNE